MSCQNSLRVPQVEMSGHVALAMTCLAVVTKRSSPFPWPPSLWPWQLGAAVVPAVPGIMLAHVLDKMNLLKILWSGRT